MRVLAVLCVTFMLIVLPIYNSIGYAPSPALAALASLDARLQEFKIEANRVYSVDTLFYDLKRLKAQYPSIIIEQLGRSYFGDPIYAVVLGEGDKTLMVTAGMHGWEWVGSYLSMRGIVDLLHSNAQGVPAAISALTDYRIVVVPLINPDGVRIAQGEKRPLVGDYNQDELRAWSANAWGVDLNRNFPHGYFKMARLLPSMPGPSLYPGREPASEKETQAVLLALEKYMPDMLVDLHSSGNCVFWNYNQEQNLNRDRQLAYAVGQVFGYDVSENSEQAIGGHLKDHFIGTYAQPAFIIEIGSYANRYQIYKEFSSLHNRFSDFITHLAFLVP